MNREKILSSMESAMSHLENSLKLLSGKKEKEASDRVWQASSDVEYCLFLLSLHYDEPEGFATKQSSSGETEIKPALTSALSALKEAKSSVENNDLDEAIKNAWKARGYLLRVLEIFEKKRKVKAEKSSTRS
jgi:hypothetical protein